MARDYINEDELRALLPGHSVENSWAHTKSRMLGRTLLVGLTMVLRLLVASFYPDFHLQTVLETSVLDRDAMVSLIIARTLLMVFVGTGYVASLLADRYFRTLSVTALVICCGLLWSDLQLFLLAALPDLTLLSLGLFSLRLVALYLLFQNYLDYRR